MKLDERYIYGHCFRPQRLQIFDVTQQQKVLRDVPCGCCYHCRISKINEWTTRMRLQSATYKNTYFVTLTIADDAPDEVMRAHHAEFTDINVHRKFQLTPITLDKPTIQKFIKRLRRYNDLPSLSYFIVGEYGHKYGRPHYHAILWCDEEITLDMLQNAWSLGGKSIGMIDYNDLVKNGTMTSSKFGHSFKYVCKYLQKKDFDFSNLPTYSEHLYRDNAINNIIYYENETTNEKLIVQDSWIPASQFNDVPPAGFVHKLSPQYVSRFKPFMLCSRSHTIGGRYFEKNKERFQRGDLRLFGVLDKNLVFPSYFLRKAKSVVCPYVPTSVRQDKDASTFSSPKTTSATLPTLETFCRKLQGTACTITNFFPSGATSFRSSLSLGCIEIADRETGEVDSYPLNEFTIYDKDNHHYLVYNGTYFDRYCFDPHTKTFEVVGNESLPSILCKMDSSFRSLLKFVAPFDVQREINEDKLRAYIESEFDGDPAAFESTRKNLEKQLLSYIADKQIKYNNTKILF